MTFFEQELRKIADNSQYIQNPKFVGRACVFRLTNDITAKMSIDTMNIHDHYEVLRIKLINRHEGDIDTIGIRFADVWGNIKTRAGTISPHAWTDMGGTEWYGFTPTSQQYSQLSESVDEYLECFAEPTEDMAEDFFMGELT